MCVSMPQIPTADLQSQISCISHLKSYAILGDAIQYTDLCRRSSSRAAISAQVLQWAQISH